MKQQTLESILLAGTFALILAASPCRTAADEPFTSKFQKADEEEGPTAGGKDKTGKGNGPEGQRGPGQEGGPQGRWGNLSQEDRDRMKSIQEKLGKEPDIQTAREALKNAQTQEARQAAMKNMKEVMDKHLSAEDRKFMDKIRKQHMKNHKQGGNPQGRGEHQGPSQGEEGSKKGDGPRGVDGLFSPGGSQGQERGGPQAEGGFKGEGKSGPEGGRPPGSGPDFGDGSHQQGGSQGVGPRGGPGGEQRPMLTDEQRQRLKSIREKYKNDPDVKACREAVKDAVTPEERELAIEEYRATMQKKMSPEDRAFFDELRKNRMRDRPTQIPPSRE